MAHIVYCSLPTAFWICMVLNRQKEIRIDLGAVRTFVQRLRNAMRLGRRDFNVCFVNDREITRLNKVYRRRARPTDVLSFPWRQEQKLDIGNWKLGTGRAKTQAGRHRNFQFPILSFEFQNFLGDVVISAPTAKRNAAAEGHSTAREVRWLIIHGLLHLLGYDHEIDRGEMAAREHELREKLRA